MPTAYPLRLRDSGCWEFPESTTPALSQDRNWIHTCTPQALSQEAVQGNSATGNQRNSQDIATKATSAATDVKESMGASTRGETSEANLDKSEAKSKASAFSLRSVAPPPLRLDGDGGTVQLLDSNGIDSPYGSEV